MTCLGSYSTCYGRNGRTSKLTLGVLQTSSGSREGEGGRGRRRGRRRPRRRSTTHAHIGPPHEQPATGKALYQLHHHARKCTPDVMAGWQEIARRLTSIH